jgi:hypothetical protein
LDRRIIFWVGQPLSNRSWQNATMTVTFETGKSWQTANGVVFGMWPDAGTIRLRQGRGATGNDWGQWQVSPVESGQIRLNPTIEVRCRTGNRGGGRRNSGKALAVGVRWPSLGFVGPKSFKKVLAYGHPRTGNHEHVDKLIRLNPTESDLSIFFEANLGGIYDTGFTIYERKVRSLASGVRCIRFERRSGRSQTCAPGKFAGTSRPRSGGHGGHRD